MQQAVAEVEGDVGVGRVDFVGVSEQVEVRVVAVKLFLSLRLEEDVLRFFPVGVVVGFSRCGDKRCEHEREQYVEQMFHGVVVRFGVLG